MRLRFVERNRTKTQRGLDLGQKATADALNSGKLRLSATAAQFAEADFLVDSGEFRKGSAKRATQLTLQIGGNGSVPRLKHRLLSLCIGHGGQRDHFGRTISGVGYASHQRDGKGGHKKERGKSLGHLVSPLVARCQSGDSLDIV